MNIIIVDRRYTDKHEWVEVNGNIGTIGISQYAQVCYINDNDLFSLAVLARTVLIHTLHCFTIGGSG